MVTRFNCPECGLRLDAETREEGATTMTCPGCGTEVDPVAAAAAPPKRAEIVVASKRAAAVEYVVPLVAGLILIFAAVICVSSLTRQAFHLNLLGALTVCVSSFLALSERPAQGPPPS